MDYDKVLSHNHVNVINMKIIGLIVNNKLNSVQILRGLAALSVVLFHYRFWLSPLYGDLTIPNKYLSWGSAGVDLFFVISGFIMFHITSKKPSGLKPALFFSIERLTRILPTYFIALFIAFYYTWEVGYFVDPQKLQNIISALTFTPFVDAYPPLYIDAGGIFVIRWTLNYELYFYLIFALCILFNKKIPGVILWILATVIAGLSMTGKVTLSTAGYETGSPVLSFLTNPIIFEFALGILAGYTVKHAEKWSGKTKLAFSLFTAIIFIYAVHNRLIEGYSLKTGVISYFILVTFVINDRIITKITPSFFVMLGNISFSWYLLHNQIGSYISWKVEANNPGVMHNAYGFTILLILSICIAWLSHKYIEGILTNKIRNRIFMSRPGKLVDMRKVNQGA
ncbi:acyltransferase [Salmonella enterica]|nr:acyltransferase [Salmonella enterica]